MKDEKRLYFRIYEHLLFICSFRLYRCIKGENPGEFRFSPTGFPPYTPFSATPSKRPLRGAGMCKNLLCKFLLYDRVKSYYRLQKLVFSKS